MRYELESIDDFVGKLQDFKVEEVAMKTKLFAADVILQPPRAAIPARPAVEGAPEIPAVPAQPEVRGKQITAVFTFTAVGLRKTLSDEYEVPLSFSETLPPAIVVTEADGKAFNEDLEQKKGEYTDLLMQANKKLSVLAGTILATQHSHYGLGSAPK